MVKVEHVVGSFQLMKSINKSLILNIIREEGEISRAEIAKRTKLTPPTVTNLVGELMKEGIVLEGQSGPSNGGRRPIMLYINKSRYYVVGVDVGLDSIRYVITDLEANIISKKEKVLPPNINGEMLTEAISDNIRLLLYEFGMNREKILGIGVGMPGKIDYKTGVCISAEVLGIQNIPLKERLEETLQIPVVVENDVRVTALGEKWFGNGRDVSNLVCINVGHVVDAGIILNDVMFGESCNAGAIGHTLIDINGSNCTCGRRGCLQEVVSHNGIKHAVKEQLKAGRETIIRDAIEGDENKINGRLVCEAVKEGDQVAIEVVNKVGMYLGIAIANLVDIINPQRIILSGGISKIDGILEAVRKVLDERGLSEEPKDNQVVLAHLKDNATVLGAATLVLHEYFLGDLVGN